MPHFGVDRVNIIIKLSRPAAERAYAAAQQNHGCTLTKFLTDAANRLAEERVERPKRGNYAQRASDKFQFSDPADQRLQDEIEIVLRDELADHFPDGVRLTDVIGFMQFERHLIDRALQTQIGRMMKNIGYKKVRARLPSRIGEPVKYGFVYRKDDGGQSNPHARAQSSS